MNYIKNLSKFTLFSSICALFLALPLFVAGQSLGTAGTISGTVTDPNSAVVSGATVTLSNAVTGYKRISVTDSSGIFRFNDVPQNTYTIRTEASGFRSLSSGLSVRSSVPLNYPITLTIGDATATVNIAADSIVVENVPTTHTNVDQLQLRKLPVRSPGNGLSDAVTLTSPGVVADSNGFMHPLGDHAQTQYTVDNQPITDQQSKAFSTQLPVNAIQSLEVITGATPAEYGDKTSLVINAITRSGLNQKKPFGGATGILSKFPATLPGRRMKGLNSPMSHLMARSATALMSCC